MCFLHIPELDKHHEKVKKKKQEHVLPAQEHSVPMHTLASVICIPLQRLPVNRVGLL